MLTLNFLFLALILGDIYSAPSPTKRKKLRSAHSANTRIAAITLTFYPQYQLILITMFATIAVSCPFIYAAFTAFFLYLITVRSTPPSEASPSFTITSQTIQALLTKDNTTLYLQNLQKQTTNKEVCKPNLQDSLTQFARFTDPICKIH